MPPHVSSSISISVSYPLPQHPQLTVTRTWANEDARKRGEKELGVEYRFTPEGEGGWWGVLRSGAVVAVMAWVMRTEVVQELLPLWAQLLLCFLILLLTQNRITSESITALPSLGLLLTTTSTSFLPLPLLLNHTLTFPLPLAGGEEKTEFIPLSRLRGVGSVVLNEGFRRWGVEYYLGVVAVENEEKVIGDCSGRGRRCEGEDREREEVREGDGEGEVGSVKMEGEDDESIGEGSREGRVKSKGKGPAEGKGKTTKEGKASPQQGRKGLVGLKVHIIFPKLRPRFPVLLEVYHGLRETMFEEWDNG